MSNFPVGFSNRVINMGAKIISSINDMPVPVLKNGVLTIIPESMEYLITQDVNSPYPIGFPVSGGRTTFTTVNRAKWIYLGTDSCFRDLDASADMETQGLVEFQAPNGNMWEINNTSGGPSWSFQSTNTPKFTNMLAMGSVNGGISGAGFNLHYGTISNFNHGLVFEGTIFFEMNLMFVRGNNALGCTIFTGQGATTSGSLNFLGDTFTIGTNETVFDIRTEVQDNMDSLNFRGCQQEGGVNGTVFAVGSLTQKSLKVTSVGNHFIPDDRNLGTSYATDNTGITTIPTNGVYVPINFDGVDAASNIERFTLTNPLTGEMRYDGISNLSAEILSTFNGIGEGKERIFSFRWVKNGLVLEDNIIASVQMKDKIRATTLLTPVTLLTGDLIKPEVTRVSGDETIIIQQYSVKVS